MSRASRDQVPDPSATPGRPPVYRYHLLRAALGAGLPGLAALGDEESAKIREQADRTFDLEALVLGTGEATKVTLPPGRVDEALGELRGRYPDQDAFLADLEANGLDESVLAEALGRELIFDAVMQQVAARRPAVSEIDERLFFELHKSRFTQGEQRTVRHILITINDEFDENRREAARARIEQLAAKLDGRANRFPSLARQHSECPTAMEDGRLGTLPRGKLYPELDAALFGLPEGGISTPVESEMGFHLLWCEKIHRERSVPFKKARGRIRELLEERAARNCQKAFISRLRGRSAPGPGAEAGT